MKVKTITIASFGRFGRLIGQTSAPCNAGAAPDTQNNLISVYEAIGRHHYQKRGGQHPGLPG
jgi:hypothetical protein